jgi:cell division control protein 6
VSTRHTLLHVQSIDSSRDAAADSLPTPVATPTKKDRRAITQQHNVFSHARLLLSPSLSTATNNGSTGSDDSGFVGRSMERENVTAFLSSRLAPNAPSSSRATRPSSLYISGPPGLGKTALLHSILDSEDFQALYPDLRVHVENCTSLGSVALEKTFWNRVGGGLGLDVSGGVEGVKAALSRTTGRQHLLILDEIDHLASTPLLQSIFNLSHASSTFTLVGIANSLTLTSTHLSFPLDSAAAPQLLHFKPYDDNEIVQIVRGRLRGLHASYTGGNGEAGGEVGALVEPNALKLCAKKVAAATGDVRIAFDVVRKAIGIVEVEERRAAGSKVVEDPSQSSSPLSHLTPTSCRKVTMTEMALALRLSGLVPPSPLSSRLSSLNFNPRNALLSIVVALQRLSPPSSLTSPSPASSISTVALNSAYKTYLEVMKREGTLTSFLSKPEFTSTLELLDDAGFIVMLSSSSTSPSRKKKATVSKKYMKGNGESDPLIELSQTVSLWELVSAIQTTPANSEGSSSAGAMEETLRISRCVMREEARRLNAKAGGTGSKTDEMAPRAGFHGTGLEGGKGDWMGKNR